MTKSASYRPSECCGGCDCEKLGQHPGEPCWGLVGMVSGFDDEDGWPLANHLCEGHRNAYEWHLSDAERAYVSEPEPVRRTPS